MVVNVAITGTSLPERCVGAGEIHDSDQAETAKEQMILGQFIACGEGCGLLYPLEKVEVKKMSCTKTSRQQPVPKGWGGGEKRENVDLASLDYLLAGWIKLELSVC
ncbi:Usherin [Clarias magur]|uniref:Usherin n=1 Tax=Clarias magur TaxID=1594786 RepID=A0A8J4URT4_CLAMG|nr:Usherin [Clarias magur]